MGLDLSRSYQIWQPFQKRQFARTDKGRSTVIAAKNEYEEKVNNMLSDDKTCEKLKADPTAKHKRELVGTFQRLKEENKIDSDQYKLLYPTAENTPRIYCTTNTNRVTQSDQSWTV